jgi:hypothetical protein
MVNVIRLGVLAPENVPVYILTHYLSKKLTFKSIKLSIDLKIKFKFGAILKPFNEYLTI